VLELFGLAKDTSVFGQKGLNSLLCRTASAHCNLFLVFGEAFKPVFVLLLAYGAMVQNAVVE
jgi:hypothetical protein